jgi:hypothetical protein
MEPNSRSEGSALLNNGVRCHVYSMAITAMKEAALNRNTLPAPVVTEANAATASPPSAGPTARARLNPALLIEIASGNSERGTNSGTIACQAGLFMAEPMFRKKVRTSSAHGEMMPARVSAQSTRAAASIQACQNISSLRRSKISAVAPAGSPSSNTGRLAAVCMSAISSGEPVSTVISQVPAVSCIQLPRLDTTDAMVRFRNSGRRSGAHPEGVTVCVAELKAQ